MKALLTALSALLGVAIVLSIGDGAGAVLVCLPFALLAGVVTSRADAAQRGFLVPVFIGALLVRVLVGTLIYFFNLQEFFGGDAITYDERGTLLLQYWNGELSESEFSQVNVEATGNWGMSHLVAIIYAVAGRNMLAVQYFNAVVGAATAPVIFLCARHIYQNLRVAKLATLFVAFFPSLVLWSSQGLKDGPIVFLLAATMLATLKLGERPRPKYVAVLVLALYGLLSFRFYIFYMAAAAVAGSFLVGMRPQKTRNLIRQLIIVVAMGLGLTYLGVLRTASTQLETFGSLQAIQTSRADLATAASGFAQDVDVSTAQGALSVLPLGMIYLLFAPFPWQLANLRQSITLPEMLVWWGSFPLLVLGIWFTVRYRLRQALPILIFTTMLTLAYSIFQGNVGTAYRQRSQILVFYFIFVSVGGVLLKERQEDRESKVAAARRAFAAAAGRERYERWKLGRGKEMEEMAQSVSRRIDF